MENLKKSFLVRGNNIVGFSDKKNFSTAPLGTVLSFAGQARPNGYLLCDGASYKVTDYPDLYAVIGNTYGGDSTNFNVPNLVDASQSPAPTMIYIIKAFHTNEGVDSDAGSGEENKIDSISVNGSPVSIDENKNVDITVPSKVSELTNDSNYQTAEQVNSTVTTEIAKVVANAPEDFDTLKEMSDWIAGHEDNASAMNSAISDNKANIETLQTDVANINTSLGEKLDKTFTGADVANKILSTDGDGNVVLKDGNEDDTMLKSVYDTDDDGIVDKADSANIATNATDATNAENLKLSDGTIVDADTINTKLSKVDTPDNLSVELTKKINKPASATNGQVLTYNGTSNEWEAQDSKGGGSGTARVNVSGIPSGYSLYYYDVSDPSTKNPVSGTSAEVGFGTYRFYASNGSDNTNEKEVIVDTLKIYNIVLKVIYAVHISMAESDPDKAVTFPIGYDNSDFSDNSYMNFSSGSFHYGDWASAFFMPRSCMLKFDGTVDYYLNEDDETKKEDGTASDVANINYGGNAMVEWGKIYFGFKGDADGNGYTFITSNSPSEGLDCYCNIDANKNKIDHFYTPKYFGSNDSSNRLRSISGQSNYVSQTGTTELSHAKANGNGWSTECYGDWTLIKHLLVLMSKSLNIQAKYGYGRCSTSNSTAIGQGTMNGKGRFWGDDSQTNGVKIFGMENWYGNIWRRIEGYVTNSSGVQLVKMCYGTRDGSTAYAYSTDGTGYVSMGTTSGTSGSGIQTMHVNDKCGVVPKALTGSTSPTTYFLDGYWYGNSCYAFVGGYWDYGLLVGAFCSNVFHAVSFTHASIGAAVSCKPLSA